MNKFSKFLLFVFSFMLLVVSIMSLFIAFDILEITDIYFYLLKFYTKFPMYAIISSVMVFILSLVAMFGTSEVRDNMKSGFAIKHDTGVIYITRETFEALILNVAKKYTCLKDIRVNVLVSEEGIQSNIFAYMLPDTLIDEISKKLQADVKDTVKKQTTVEISVVNLKIKGIAAKEKGEVK